MDPPGLRLGPLLLWLAMTASPSTPPARCAGTAAGGPLNVTYRLTTPTGTSIVSPSPLGHVTPSAHDMAGEYRVLERQWIASDTPPTALVLCEDDRRDRLDVLVM